MILRDLVMTVNYSSASLSEPLQIYQYDRGITLKIKVMRYNFIFNKHVEEDIIVDSSIISARALILKPDGQTVFECPRTPVEDDCVIIHITLDWTDELREVGNYQLQLQLYGSDHINERVTLPPVGFTVAKPLGHITEEGIVPAPDNKFTSESDFFNLRTNNGINMDHLFYSYQGSELDVSILKTANATSMLEMFSQCDKLKTITGLNNFKTSNVTNMGLMFYDCYYITKLDLSSFDTRNVTFMGGMFCICENLEELDIRNFDMTNVTNTTQMFIDCNDLHTIRLDNCNKTTISKIIDSEGFPTNEILNYETGETIQRKMYVDPNNIGNLEAPENWIFVDSDGNEIIPGPIEQ